MLLRKLATTLLVSLLTVLVIPTAMAQETTSALRGTVSDVSGKPLSGVTITIVHTPTGTRSTQTTNDSGVFDARGLRVGGPYTVEIAAGGYRTEKYDNLFLTVGETGRLNANLEESIQEILVSATAARDAIEVGSSTTLDRDKIEAVVSISRDIR
ncbi:MAG: carboxypeptidase-like regulatory domain-containing protein, partial [Gammaproteobacteria bacterium]